MWPEILSPASGREKKPELRHLGAFRNVEGAPRGVTLPAKERRPLALHGIRRFMGLRDRCPPWKTEAAKRLRSCPTVAETIVWDMVRKKALGMKFRRQSILRGWIADFWCPRVKLVVEVDGGYHYQRAEEDAKRDKILGQLGITTLRIPNRDVFRDPIGVKHRIQLEIDQLRRKCFAKLSDSGL